MSKVKLDNTQTVQLSKLESTTQDEALTMHESNRDIKLAAPERVSATKSTAKNAVVEKATMTLTQRSSSQDRIMDINDLKNCLQTTTDLAQQVSEPQIGGISDEMKAEAHRYLQEVMYCRERTEYTALTNPLYREFLARC